MIKNITDKFLQFLRKFSLDPVDNPNAIQNVSNNKFLPPESLVLHGSEIFNIFFEGTKSQDVDKEGNMVEVGLRESF